MSMTARLRPGLIPVLLWLMAASLACQPAAPAAPSKPTEAPKPAAPAAPAAPAPAAQPAASPAEAPPIAAAPARPPGKNGGTIVIGWDPEPAAIDPPLTTA